MCDLLDLIFISFIPEPSARHTHTHALARLFGICATLSYTYSLLGVEHLAAASNSSCKYLEQMAVKMKGGGDGEMEGATPNFSRVSA